ncbi:acyl-CoA thioester hydrolase, YbgC/YbaW family [Desulfitobacterium dichloroeliminans LMG P-21439]|uniref:Acyl-CoA thioester hydrolase, YbgC/YbaW family n=1 Tax=Desulfitobacterium dichloroeliminans (strain LMG P-21439 / DCA1) TaxID=871963 RepID=L0F9I5_DESDL|nr:thioesterase family protein [Desulfitobacterium dichloroeliminans]AGA69326.1 acyl-CoA thioester hydrolase, YbgC/YbaW family [Desulfitobacterium dichloroeliminans LMG P-21439]
MFLTHQTPVRVRYAETDQMGIVYHSNYLIWFEVGRTELLRNAGLAYTTFEEQGLAVAVVDAACRYRRPAHYDDQLVVETCIESFSSRKLTFAYKVFRENTLLAEGKTTHVYVDRTGKSTDARKYPLWKELERIVNENKEIPF